MNLTLSIGLSSNPRTWPVLDGRVRPQGIDLVITRMHPSEIFWRQLRFAEFDVSEMSISSLMMTQSQGDDRWTGLPVFTMRSMFHTGILVRKDAGIDAPADLKGRRVGVPEYQQTAALWIRGILEHEFGVAPSDMEFWMERTPDRSHAFATGSIAPPGVTINQIPAEKNIGTMMDAGELDAALFYIVDANLVDRSTIDLWNHPDIKPLFPDPHAEGVRYFEKTGLYPINHGMVVKRSVAEEHPWVVINLLKAFEEANEIANAERVEHARYHIETGLLPASATQALATPLVRHGMVANRTTIETIAQYSHEQGLTPRVATVEELFAASTLER